MADAVGLQIDQIRKDMAATFARGALIDQSAWGAQTAQHLNMENSYYGALLGFYQAHKKLGHMVPND